MSILFNHFRTRFTQAQSLAVDYPWDQWRYTDYFLFDDDETAAPFEPLSDLANRALVLATAEYIAARLWAHADVAEALTYFDCAWGTIAVEGCCDYALLYRDDWPGPVRGALRAAMLVVNDTLFEARDDLDYPARCVWIWQLARHVIPDAALAEFETWFQWSLDRLARHWADLDQSGELFANDFDRGPPVGPCTFLAMVPGTPEAAEDCLVRHIAGIPVDNPWRVDPDSIDNDHSHGL